MSEAVFAEGLTKAYNGKTVVNNLNLSVKSGTVFGLLGANGAGKSTTIECMLGTKQADAGTVRLLGQDPKRKRRALFQLTPVSPVFILGIELLMYVIYCAVSLATLSVAALLFGVKLHGSLLAFLGSWVLTMLSTLSVGMLAGGIAKNTKQASIIASVLYFQMLVFSGTTLPIEVMPKAMQKVVSFFPLTQGLTMMKNAFLGIGTDSILIPVCVMLGVTALCTVLSVRFFRWE